MANFQNYGKHLFRGTVAKPYLETQGLDERVLATSTWTTQPDKADRVSFSTFCCNKFKKRLCTHLFCGLTFLFPSIAFSLTPLGRSCCPRMGQGQWCFCVHSLVPAFGFEWRETWHGRGSAGQHGEL